MNHADHVRLIAPGIPAQAGGRWADFGAGTGAFTLALRDVAGPDVEITAVDRDPDDLRELRRAMERAFPGTLLRTHAADFTRPLELPPLAGILAANSLHYVRDQAALLRLWHRYLVPGGRLIVVEYDTDRGNHWVPYALSFETFAAIAQDAGFTTPERIGTQPSRFLGQFFAGLALARADNRT
ncbi:MAG: class I SAM-dependent methyltransferase [Chloroflexota bacterium]|nr:class I SAM-dependent methyltransferase [Chloroflexota bacterium]